MTMLNILKNNFFLSDLKMINFTIFLLFLFPISIISGPFLPDLILSLISLIGLILFFKKKINIPFYKEIIFLWIFYLFAIISSLLSKQIMYSFDYSLLYFRFIIFAHFFVFLLIEYPKIKTIFLKGIIISFSIMIIYSSIELILYFNMDEIDGIRRLHLLFSDEAVVGRFMVSMLPILIFFIVLNKNNIKSKLFKYLLIIILILSFFLVIYSGERAALLSLMLLICLYFLIFAKFNKKLSIYFFFGSLIFLLVNIFTNQDNLNRIFQDFDRNISLNPEMNLYLNYSLVSFEMFKDSPIIGKGPKMFRIFCQDNKFNNYLDLCNMHPHSIYAQLLGEMGLIGLLFLLTAFIYILYKYLKNLFLDNPDRLYLFASVGFIINFFPLIPSTNFFNNWINSLYYLPIIVIIYSLNRNIKF